MIFGIFQKSVKTCLNTEKDYTQKWSAPPDLVFVSLDFLSGQQNTESGW